MMVVMLIMSIILAAMAPVMTTRSKADSSSPWRFSPNNPYDAFFGIGGSQIALIGMPSAAEDGSDNADRLIINTATNGSCKNHIAFKHDAVTLGRLLIKEDNIVLGSGDLSSNSGTRLSSFGINSLESNTSGSDNTAIGAQTLTNNTTGECNTAIGQGSLMNNISGEGNNALGTSSLRNNTSGSHNTALGQDTLYNSNGSYNTALGWYSMNANTSGEYNTAVGANSLYSLTEGSHNVAFGYESLKYLGSSNSYNTAVGDYSQYNTTWGQYNTSIGYDSLRDNDGGSYNVAVGYRSNYDESSRHSSSGSVSIGGEALAFANNAISIGRYAKASGEQSVSLGSSANASGHDSISIGGSSVSSNESSIAIGASSKASEEASTVLGRSATASAFSIALGDGAEASGVSSTALGRSATASGSPSSIAVGNGATASGSNSTAFGVAARASGSQSIALGDGATAFNTRSTAIGYNACQYATAANVTCLGAASGPPYSNGHNISNMVYLGTSADTVYIPGNLVVDGHVILGVNKPSYVFVRTANQEAQINQSGKSLMSLIKSEDWEGGDDNTCRYTPSHLAPDTRHFFKEYIGSSWEETKSDLRLKYVGKESQSGLDKIKQLKVFNYTFKKDETKTPHVGVIAQDLQKVFPDAVKKGTDGFLSIRFEDMFFAMINAIKELDLKYQAQETRINELEARIERLEDKILY